MTRRSARRGGVLLATMACLLLAAVMMSHLLHGVVQQRLQQRREAWRRQAAWLALSGLTRARTALASDADYGGETWRPPAELLTAGPAEIVIEVAGDGPQTRIRVRADYPSDSLHRARQSLTLAVPRPLAGDAR